MNKYNTRAIINAAHYKTLLLLLLLLPIPLSSKSVFKLRLGFVSSIVFGGVMRANQIPSRLGFSTKLVALLYDMEYVTSNSWSS